MREDEREMTSTVSTVPSLDWENEKSHRGHFGDNWGNLNMEYILDIVYQWEMSWVCDMVLWL